MSRLKPKKQKKGSGVRLTVGLGHLVIFVPMPAGVDLFYLCLVVVKLLIKKEPKMYQRFVVRSNSKEGRAWRKMDFQLVDLNEKSISGVYGDKDEAKKLEGHHFHLGASRYSVINSNWKAISLPETHTIPTPAVMSGKLYCFGSQCLLPEIYDFGFTWKRLELPSELRGRVVSAPVIADHEKSRIIVHVPELNQLYAFCPPEDYFSRGGSTGGTWSRIATYIYSWGNVVAVVDDLICFHSWQFVNLLEAFDLRSNKWVQVVADLSNVEITLHEFNRLFKLPGRNGLMCLAGWVPIRPVAIKDPPSVHFLRFGLQRSPDPLVIKLTAIDYQSYSIPSAGSVSDFVMLQYG